MCYQIILYYYINQEKCYYFVDRSLNEQYVQNMNRKEIPKSSNNESHLDILREVHNNPNLSQRDLAKNLDMSLGKLNYLIRSLANKGLIKINNFRKSNRKFGYIYVLTPRGIKQKLNLTVRFMKRKIKEYDELKSEIERGQ